MKNISILLLFISCSIYAQVNKEHFNSLSADNKTLYNHLVKEQTEKETRIRAYLQNNSSTKRRYIDPDGTVFEIKDIYNGMPIYLSTDNVSAAIATKTNHLQLGGSLGLDLNGAGMIVGVWDGGPVQNTHPEFAISSFDSRVVVVDNETPDGDVGFSNHGTHVAGTIGASGIDPQAKGMAPDVEIRSYGWINDYVEMFMAVTGSSGQINLSNHSYGVPVASYVNTGSEWVIGAYIQDSRTIDQLIYNNPKYLPVFSAGNSGGVFYNGQSVSGLDKLTGDKTAKNNLVVANANPLTTSNGDLFNLTINPGSSQGPTDDFRIKPDIAADGTNVYSTTTGGTYSIFSGTSMSAPNTTGTLVLLQQYYEQLNNSFMNASTLKALVCHTAVDDDTNSGPDPYFGWGFLDAKESAEVISGTSDGSSLISELTLENTETYSLTFLANAGEKLSVTLCWTDLPGTISNGTLNDPTPVLINDLDVRITKDGTTFFPWRLSPSIIGGVTNSKGDNNVDNVERIDIEAPETGLYTLSVSHKGTLQGFGGQNYSLIVTGNNLILSTDEVSALNDFKLVPNPAKDYFNLSFNIVGDDNITVNIFDINGRNVQKAKYNNYESSRFNEIFDTSNLEPGIYLLNIATGNNTTTEKLIIK